MILPAKPRRFGHGLGSYESMARLIVCLLECLLLGSVCCSAVHAGVASGLPPVTITAGFTPTAFLQSNRNDVEAALKVLTETVGRELGYEVTLRTRFFPDLASFCRALDAGELNFAAVDSLTYVASINRGDLVPIFIPSNEGMTGRRYQLLVRRDRNLSRLEDLRDKKLVEFQSPDVGVGHIWLLSRLQANGLGPGGNFFHSIQYVAKPSAAVLSVFFGTNDACVIDEAGFKLMTELNPQVGLQLQSMETSVPLVGAVMCASEKNWSPAAFRPVLVKALGDLHRRPAGRQMLALFKIDELVPFQEEGLDSVRELWFEFAQSHLEARR